MTITRAINFNLSLAKYYYQSSFISSGIDTDIKLTESKSMFMYHSNIVGFEVVFSCND